MSVKRIEREALKFILEVSSSCHPNEFAGILRSENDVITEVLVLPGTYQSEESALLQLHMLPLGSHDCGTVHSHPSPSLEPSSEDLAFFGKFGEAHLIVAFPYDEKSWRAYDRRGRKIELKTIG